MLADDDSVWQGVVSVVWCPDFENRCYMEGRAGCPCTTVAVALELLTLPPSLCRCGIKKPMKYCTSEFVRQGGVEVTLSL